MSGFLQSPLTAVHLHHSRGGSRVLGKGGSNKDIHHWGRGRAPPVTARGSGGALIAPPMGSGAKPQPLFAFAFI